MGFWAWLTGKSSNVIEVNDVIWMTPAAKWQGLRRAIQEEASVAQLVVAHFPKTFAELQDELTKATVQFFHIWRAIIGNRGSPIDRPRQSPTIAGSG